MIRLSYSKEGESQEIDFEGDVKVLCEEMTALRLYATLTVIEELANLLNGTTIEKLELLENGQQSYKSALRVKVGEEDFEPAEIYVFEAPVPIDMVEFVKPSDSSATLRKDKSKQRVRADKKRPGTIYK